MVWGFTTILGINSNRHEVSNFRKGQELGIYFIMDLFWVLSFSIEYYMISYTKEMDTEEH